LALENRALRQQVAIPRRQVKKPTLTLAERLFWVGLMRTWDGWKDSLILVQSETVIRPGTAASGVYVLFDIDPPHG